MDDNETLGAAWHNEGSLLKQGRYAEAFACFGRAVEAKEKGDVMGRIDHESLGLSLHQAGCLRRKV